MTMFAFLSARPYLTEKAQIPFVINFQQGAAEPLQQVLIPFLSKSSITFSNYFQVILQMSHNALFIQPFDVTLSLVEVR
jgi:hypothetical protein